MWEERWGSIDRYNMITTEQYLEDMHHVLNDKNLRKKVHNFLPYLFKVSSEYQYFTYIVKVKARLFTNIKYWVLKPLYGSTNPECK